MSDVETPEEREQRLAGAIVETVAFWCMSVEDDIKHERDVKYRQEAQAELNEQTEALGWFIETMRKRWPNWMSGVEDAQPAETTLITASGTVLSVIRPDTKS